MVRWLAFLIPTLLDPGFESLIRHGCFCKFSVTGKDGIPMGASLKMAIDNPATSPFSPANARQEEPCNEKKYLNVILNLPY